MAAVFITQKQRNKRRGCVGDMCLCRNFLVTIPVSIYRAAIAWLSHCPRFVTKLYLLYHRKMINGTNDERSVARNDAMKYKCR